MSPASAATARPSRTSQWLVRRNRDFGRFWAGQTVSTFGDQVTALALPTVAIVTLHASVFYVGLLAASSYLPYPVLGLFAGAWVDRRKRRNVLIAADAVRLGALAIIPLIAALGSLNIWALFGVGFLSGAATCFFSAAYQSYLPSIAPERDIVVGNSLMEVSNSAAQVAGPSIAGALIGTIGSVSALLIDSASYGVSVISLMLIRTAERPPARPRRPLVADVREGLSLVWGHRLVRQMAMTTALANIGRGLALELFLLFAYRAIQQTPLVVGLLLAAGSVASLAGAALSRKIAQAAGLGRTLLLAGAGKGLPWLLVPFALVAPPVPVEVAVLVVSSFFIPVWNVNSVSLRQYMTDRAVLARVAATVRTATSSAVPLAGLLGGGLATAGSALLGTRLGLAAVLALGGALWAAATLALPLRGVWAIRDPDDAISRYGRVSAASSDHPQGESP